MVEITYMKLLLKKNTVIKMFNHLDLNDHRDFDYEYSVDNIIITQQEVTLYIYLEHNFLLAYNLT